ncbi:hypothetical protein OHB12_06045 [Nocardia sp. NBC_01730]|uniref:transcriptional regulator n=1 Tax=Nocardia sp. NBC_01730 TaxID=2975998 RepID=UPI002E139D1F|nr:hypothetical protein OHB12_06045 [Nocardia sp. NBC_01730]
MNFQPAQSGAIDPTVWEGMEMRKALAARNLKRVFELLQRCGISQRAIGRATVLGQNEIYEVLHKGRQLGNYDVLARVADGLGIPRGYMGLAYGRTTEMALDLATATCSTAPNERDEVRQLLSHAANVTMGTAVGDIARWWQPFDHETAPAPARIGDSDVEHIRTLTAAMRMVDYRHGGGACRDAVAAQVRWAQQLLGAECSTSMSSKLYAALADLHNLAGWTSFDVGMYSIARQHFGRALELAHGAGDHSLAANVLYRTGRLHLHRGMAREALRFFQLGQIAAQDSGCTLTVAMLCANEGWAYAMLGDANQMWSSLKRAQDEFARAESAKAQAWVRFFGDADLNALVGVALTGNREATEKELSEGIEHIETAISLRGPDMTRSRVFELTALATAYLRSGSRDIGLDIGQQAVATAGAVRSIRTVDRLSPLRNAAITRKKDADLQYLVRKIDSLQASV